MSWTSAVVLAGLPEGLAGAIGAAGVLLLLLMVAAFGAFVYRSLTGGIDWPEDDAESEAVTRNDDEDEWKYS